MTGNLKAVPYTVTVPAGDGYDFDHMETRWRLVDTATSDIVDDAQGYDTAPRRPHTAHTGTKPPHAGAAHGRRLSNDARRHGGGRMDGCAPNWRTCNCRH